MSMPPVEVEKSSSSSNSIFVANATMMEAKLVYMWLIEVVVVVEVLGVSREQ